jgi:hypothetical protein
VKPVMVKSSGLARGARCAPSGGSYILAWKASLCAARATPGTSMWRSVHSAGKFGLLMHDVAAHRSVPAVMQAGASRNPAHYAAKPNASTGRRLQEDQFVDRVTCATCTRVIDARTVATCVSSCLVQVAALRSVRSAISVENTVHTSPPRARNETKTSNLSEKFEPLSLLSGR